MGNPAGFGIRPLWVAHYTSKPSPKLPSAWPNYTFWQFTDSGRVDGIDGPVDLNRFDGDQSDLAGLGHGGPLVVPGDPDPVDDDLEPRRPAREGQSGTIMRVEAEGLNFRIAEWRVNKRTYDDAKTMDKFSSHCDVVVRITESHAIAIGGNVSNSVTMRKTRYPLDASGKLKPGSSPAAGNRTFAVLENRTG